MHVFMKRQQLFQFPLRFLLLYFQGTCIFNCLASLCYLLLFLDEEVLLDELYHFNCFNLILCFLVENLI